MAKLTIGYLKRAIADEKEDRNDYIKHAKGKEGKFLKEIAHDELDHRKKLEKRLKKMEKEQKRHR